MGTTVEKFNYAFGTKDLLKTEINKINNVLTDNSTFRSYPQELFNGFLDILNNGTDTLWNNLEKVSQTGTEAVLEGVETAPIKMVLNGNTSQDGTPTPDTPVEVKVVTGENVVSVSGKNLLNMNYLVEANADKTYAAQGFWTFKLSDKIGTYTLSRENADMVSGGSYIAWGEGNDITTAYNRKTWIAHQSQSYLNNKKQTKTNSGELWLFLSTNETRIQNIPNDYGYLMFELGSTATPYVPYSKTDYPISLGTIEMCKIGNYQDYLYKNNGKWYVHKSVVRFPLLSSYGWYNSGTYAFKYRTSLGIVIPSNNNIVIDMFCNYFKKASTNALYNGNVDYGISISTDKGILIRNKDLSTSIADFKTYLDENNIYAYIPLATPTEEEITDETLLAQLEAIYKAKSVKDKTYITQTNDELPFILDVEAIKEYEVN